jgi:hypothetical protein
LRPFCARLCLTIESVHPKFYLRPRQLNGAPRGNTHILARIVSANLPRSAALASPSFNSQTRGSPGSAFCCGQPTVKPSSLFGLGMTAHVRAVSPWKGQDGNAAHRGNAHGPPPDGRSARCSAGCCSPPSPARSQSVRPTYTNRREGSGERTLRQVATTSARCSSGTSCSLAPWYLGMTRAWPLESGPMSRKANLVGKERVRCALHHKGQAGVG